MADWETLGAIDPKGLVEARLRLHGAAQAAATVGRQLLEHQPDHSEQSFQWLAGPRALAQGTVASAVPFRSAIRPSPPALLMLGADGGALSELSLDGSALGELYEWVRRETEHRLGRPLEHPLERSEGDFPASTDGAAFAELGRYFASADRLLWDLATRHAGASAVRCWPHHFDIALLIVLDPDEDPETARSVGAGMSPGDDAIPEPYFYVRPWPTPTSDGLPALDGGGRWNTQGWVGAVLEASRFTATGSNGAQAAQIEAFLNSAVGASLRLIGGEA